MGLRDTGAERTLVRPEVVSPQDLVPGKTLSVSGIGGVEPALPVAKVFLDWGAGRGVREVGVTSNIPANVLLGTDLGRIVSQYVATEPPSSAPQECHDSTVNVDVLNVPPTVEEGLKPEGNPYTDTTHTGLTGRTGEETVGESSEVEGGAAMGSVGPLSESSLLSLGPLQEEEQAMGGGGVPGEEPPGKTPGQEFPTPGMSGGQGSLPDPATWSGAGGKQALPMGTAVVAAVTRSGSAGAQGALQRSEGFPLSDQVAAESDSGQETDPRELTADVAVSSILATSSQGFQAALEADASLKALKEQAAQPPGESDRERVVWDQGRLYRVTVQQGSPEAWPRDRQLGVPYPLRKREGEAETASERDRGGGRDSLRDREEEAETASERDRGGGRDSLRKREGEAETASERDRGGGRDSLRKREGEFVNITSRICQHQPAWKSAVLPASNQPVY
ncbi:uncharacterized protein LOC143803670 [Ranitomeya variabilis]|uniref:uncharacterized protein LOC143803670 n=1 Tax=Ranitomeya variabilis TaxID=490064 RepID=UPI004056077C